jgi:3-oxoacyl-[acyl-carrier-protein] synthase II
MRGAPARRSRVAVTGVGVICALGRNQKEFWAAAVEGRCGISPLSLFDAAGCLSRMAAEAGVVRPSVSLDRMERRRHSRTDLLCLLAGEEAVSQAGLSGEAVLEDFGISLGTSTGGMLEAEEYCRESMQQGLRRARPSRVLRLPTSAPADALGRRFRSYGPRLSNMTACASSAAAVGIAADLIREGGAPGMICGGGDALCRMTYAGFNALRLVDPDTCRPFDAGRRGLSLGEGAGILILEDWERALRRGAKPLAEFMDYGCTCDAHHMTGPHPEGRGAAAAMIEAMERSGVPPDRIGHVNAHGTGTPMNDAAERTALLAALGPERAARVPLTSTKSMIGHLLGGAGGVEAVTLVLSLMHQEIPPTLGWSRSDPGARLEVVAPRSRKVPFEYGLSNSFGFGGTNCSLVFRRSE